MRFGAIITLLLLYATNAWATISPVQFTWNGVASGTTVSCTLPGQTALGNLVVVGFKSSSGSDVTTVSDTVNTWTEPAQADATGQTRGEQWATVAASAATLTITGTRSGSSGLFQCVVLEFAGTATSFGLTGSPATGTTGGNVASLAIPSITTTTSSVIVSILATKSTEAFVAPAGWVMPAATIGTRIAAAYRIEPTAGTYSGTWTFPSGSNQAAVTVVGYSEGGGSSAGQTPTEPHNLTRLRIARKNPATTPLGITITSPNAGDAFGTTTALTTFSGTAVGTGATSVTWACGTCTPTSGTATGVSDWTFNATLAVGANTVTVTVHDSGAGTSTDSIVGTYTVEASDVVNPTVQITGPTAAASGSGSTSPQTISGTASDNVAVTSVTWTCDVCSTTSGSATYASGNWSFSAILASGVNTIVVTASDASGNSAADTLSWTYVPPGGGAESPVVTITQPSASTFTTSSKVVVFTGTCTDDVRCLKNNWTCTDCIWSWTSGDWASGAGDAGHAPELANPWSQDVAPNPGSNTFLITATDDAGNTNTKSVTFTYQPELEMNSFSLNRGEAGVAYTSQTLNATCYQTPCTWGASGLPSGLSLSTGGVLSGTPASAGTSDVTITVTDNTGEVVSRNFKLYVAANGAFVGPNAYYDTLCALPTALNCKSLRSQANIDATDSQTSTNPWFTYNYAGDTFFDKRDAAKLYITPTPCSVTKGWNAAGKCVGSDLLNSIWQLDFPFWLDQLSTDSYVVIWDQWMSTSVRDFAERLGTWKHFQFRTTGNFPNVPLQTCIDGSPLSTCHDGSIHFELQSRFTENVCSGSNVNCANVYAPSIRVYGVNASNPPTMQDSTGKNPVDHTGAGTSLFAIQIPTGKWVRYIAYLEGGKHGDAGDFDSWKATCAACATLPDGPWTRYSVWILDEDTGAQRLAYQMPFYIEQRYMSFLNFEFSTSAVPEQIVAPLTMYYRNVVILKNYSLTEADTTVFQKPLR